MALCPLCPDAAIFANSDTGPILHGIIQINREVNGIAAYVVRSPDDVHDDCSGGWLLAEESGLFDVHARSVATFASGIRF